MVQLPHWKRLKWMSASTATPPNVPISYSYCQLTSTAEEHVTSMAEECTNIARRPSTPAVHLMIRHVSIIIRSSSSRSSNRSLRSSGSLISQMHVQWSKSFEYCRQCTVSSQRHLHSPEWNLLHVPRHRLSIHSWRAFAIARLSAGNSILDPVCNPNATEAALETGTICHQILDSRDLSYSRFRQSLKTFYTVSGNNQSAMWTPL